VEGDFVSVRGEATEGEGGGGGVEFGGLDGGEAEEEGVFSLQAQPVADGGGF
jgi:hypothetical protein